MCRSSTWKQTLYTAVHEDRQQIQLCMKTSSINSSAWRQGIFSSTFRHTVYSGSTWRQMAYAVVHGDRQNIQVVPGDIQYILQYMET